MIAKIIAGQRKGKGIVGVALCLWLMAFGAYTNANGQAIRYKPTDCCGNASIFIEGYRRFHNKQLISLLRVMVEKHVSGKIIYIAEADRAFPPRFWHDQKQTHALIGLQQDEKLGNWFIYDTHWRGVDVLLDSATQIEIIPEYRPALDCVDVQIVKPHDLEPHFPLTLERVSERVFPWFNTYEPVD